MSKGKPAGLDTERTLQTLDQLSKTIAVMSEVVERLKKHLGGQPRECESRFAAETGACAAAAGRESRIVAPQAARDWNSDGADLDIGDCRRKLSRKASRVIH